MEKLELTTKMIGQKKKKKRRQKKKVDNVEKIKVVIGLQPISVAFYP